ncbi:polysaccharide deacetylase family protein [Myxococcota bacterium]|nr:polysaccharide deacetylase family protein [Myxococcota bacterium]
MTAPARPIAAVSLDADNQWSYMKTHGDAGWESFPSYLDVLMPYTCDLFDELGIRITYFIVGQDAALPVNRNALALVTARGHEVGNHSFKHEPWLHRYSRAEIKDELSRAEQAIGEACGVRPVGFRGPGFSLSTDVLETLADRGYTYDGSTLPTWIGPLARAYYFRQAKLTAEQREERSMLFGRFSEGLQPNGPYRWRLPSGRTLLELPVSTIPALKTPFHLSYLIYLARFSDALLDAYLTVAIEACRRLDTPPSFLLHPLDVLGGDQVPALRFFPGMDLDAARKREIFLHVLGRLRDAFELLPMNEYARRLNARTDLPVRRAAA